MRKRISQLSVIRKFILTLQRFFDVTYGRKKSSLAMLRETITNYNHQNQWI